MTRFEKMKTMGIDDIVNWAFNNTGCHLCSRRNAGSCSDIVGGCKKYIREFFETKLDEEKIKYVSDGTGEYKKVRVSEVACPVCSGRGYVPKNFYDVPGETISFADFSSQAGTTTCKTCGGKGTIEITLPLNNCD